jgi:hypothetical protein
MIKRFAILPLLLLFNLAPSGRSAGWTLTEAANSDGPGREVAIKLDETVVGRFVFGEGQIKPYLHICNETGELLTNGGLDREGKPVGRFPHHRGIFIGWKTVSELGSFDLWHMNNGGKMEVLRFAKLEGTKQSATLVAEIAWRAGKKDEAGNDRLLTETRTLIVTRPEGKRTQVDARFLLTPARDLRLAGDLQHSGVHFRASDEVSGGNKQTSYLWQPDLPGAGGKVASTEMQWCRLLFPFREKWYACTELSAPSNPVEELSWRDYGRFGFFFKRSVKAGEPLALDYRFLIEQVSAPAANGKLTSEQSERARKETQERYQDFARSRTPGR